MGGTVRSIRASERDFGSAAAATLLFRTDVEPDRLHVIVPLDFGHVSRRTGARARIHGSERRLMADRDGPLTPRFVCVEAHGPGSKP